MSATVLYTAVVGFAGGVVVELVFPAGRPVLFVIMLLACAMLLYEALNRFAGRRSNAVGALAALAFFGFVLGVVRTDAMLVHAKDDALDGYIGQRVVVEGVVVQEPDRRETSARITVQADTLTVGPPVDTTPRTRVLIIADRHTALEYGDRVRVNGELERPESFESETGRTFNYPMYLAKDGIYYTMFRPEIERIGIHQGGGIVRTLISVKEHFLLGLTKVIPEPHASLAAGLIVGAKRSLGEALLNDFRTVGLVHVVVLSGYNLSIVAAAIGYVVSRFFGRTGATLFGSLAIIFFALIVGGGATVVRASIMAIIALIARASGREYDMSRALLCAGVIMVIHSPLILLYDPSFQLSFLATLSLVVAAPHIALRVRFIPDRFNMREIIVATLATQLFVLPLLLYQSGELSLIALPANLLVLPLIPVTMLVGALAGGASMVSESLAFPFAAAAHALLSFELFVVDMFARVPFASVSLPAFPVVFVIASYAVIGIWFVCTHTRNYPAVNRAG